MKTFCKSTKRGLSIVVTSVILISAVAIMGTSVTVWSNSIFSQKQALLEESFATSLNKLDEHITIEKVWFDTSPVNLGNVTLSNTGIVGLNVTEIKFVDSTTRHTLTTLSITDGGLRLGEIYSAILTYNWIDDVSYDVVVTTERGNIFRTQVIP